MDPPSQQLVPVVKTMCYTNTGRPRMPEGTSDLLKGESFNLIASSDTIVLLVRLFVMAGCFTLCIYHLLLHY